MVSTVTPLCNYGWQAAPFALAGVDGQTHTLETARGPNGLLVMFICNHCPYVKAILPRLLRDTRELATLGIGAIAIMANDPADYPEDSWEHMQRIARAENFPFPYVLDATQDVARTYGAVCTPDFFGFNSTLELQYRGRLDASRKEAAAEDARRELFEAMKLIAQSGRGPTEQVPSIGCSIKWRGE